MENKKKYVMRNNLGKDNLDYIMLVFVCVCMFVFVCHHPPSLLRSSASLALFVNYPNGGTEHRQLDRSNLEISGCPILNSKY